jgi:hypothetical protein
MRAIAIQRINIAEIIPNRNRSLLMLVLRARAVTIQPENKSPTMLIQLCADGAGRPIDLPDKTVSKAQAANTNNKILLLWKILRFKSMISYLCLLCA